MDWDRLTLPANARKTSAGEWHWPCPYSDSKDDSAWVAPNRQQLGCRKCSADGEGGLGEGANLEQHARHLGIWTEPKGTAAERLRRPARPRASRADATAASTGPPAKRPDLPGLVWAASIPADGTPGAVYLAKRAAWPGGEVLPASVRWVTAAEYSRIGGSPRLPAGAAGALVYGYAMPGDEATCAAEVEAVRADGAAVEFQPQGKRPSVYTGGGSPFARGARVFVARQWTSGEVWIVEGPIEALTRARPGELPAGDGVLGAHGTAGFTPAAVAAVGGRIVVSPDRDAAGDGAAERLAEALALAGQPFRVRRAPAPFSDWNEWAQGLAVGSDAAVEALEREGMRDG